MFKNYFKLGLRNLAKNRLSSIINILGLALAVGCCMVIFEFFDFSMHFDNFNHKLNNLFVIERVTGKNGDQQLWGDSPAPMGPMLKSDFPQIKNITRVNSRSAIIKQGDNIFRENVSFIDDAFYTMFDFPVKWGNRRHFTDADGIVLTENLSEKLFGHQNPAGKNVSLHFNDNGHDVVANFTVKGVFDKEPDETSWYFHAVIPRSRMAALGMNNPGDWTQRTDVTFFEADNEAVLLPIAGQGKKYVQLYNAANKDDKITGFHFQPLKTMNFHAYQVNNSHFNSTHIAAYLMLLVIGIATLLLVYFNYMNIAIASASTRLKEIGVRKIMGSNRRQIIVQFILENVAVLAIFISCLGLLGLAMFTAGQRVKEIGIRKVLGASVGSLFSLLSSEFIMLILIALLIATPLAWYAMNKWLQGYAYHAPVQWWMFALSACLIILIALATVSFQAIRAALVNPVKSLKAE